MLDLEWVQSGTDDLIQRWKYRWVQQSGMTFATDSHGLGLSFLPMLSATKVSFPLVLCWHVDVARHKVCPWSCHRKVLFEVVFDTAP
jgi:hypothetical protein